MTMCNMYAWPEARISSDEEERRRFGYKITAHFRGEGIPSLNSLEEISPFQYLAEKAKCVHFQLVLKMGC